MFKGNFLGRGWTFPPSFIKEKGGVEMVSDVKDITQSIKIILSTRKGERLTNPYFGCAMHDYLFEPINEITRNMISDAIRNALIEYEPRIIIEDIKLDFSEQLEGIVSVELHFVVRKINTRHNIVFPFYKIEGSLVDEV